MAISLPAPLFKKAEALARKLKVSRSRLIALALESLSRRFRAREMLAALNAAHEEGADETEELLGKAMRGQARRRLEGEW
jgi:metal-responsive CopG/Arc/MetJ family transcriptional regulator